MAAILKHTNVDMRRGLTTFFRSLKPVDLSEPERSGPIKPRSVRYEGRFSANGELRSIGAARKKVCQFRRIFHNTEMLKNRRSTVS